ncbi:MAG TPA: fumarylacetoacetate hydrolase family protein [Albidovulum sp.]|uniref:fumarylacetoacetate hydrolase family protein n=1 Tax=Albidovulum sp. TaxID=1872424 RepID=UPI002B8A37F6|nr:fumarylacetoacetate hydrolase family protein [Albidovulum sp.]
MTKLLFPSPPPALLPVTGTEAMYPVTRIFCVGRNYAEHAKEMGSEVDREAPFYFTKLPAHLAQSGATVPYPPGTSDFHHEMEFVVALGAPAFRVSVGQAMEAVFGYAAGLDMTRRDLQAASKEKRRSWDTGKDFENAAVIGPITPKAGFGEPGPQAITLKVGERLAQSAHLSDMVWSVAEIIAHLSTLYHLGPGDLIMTGTPAGVGPVVAGDRLHGEVEGLAAVELVIAP